MTNAHNEQSSWRTALQIFCCLPLNSTHKPPGKKPLNTAPKRKLKTGMSNVGSDEKTIQTLESIVYDEPPAVLYHSTLLDIISERSSYHTTLEQVPDDGESQRSEIESQRSRIASPTPPPKALVRLSTKSFDEQPEFCPPIESKVSRDQCRSWPCAPNPKVYASKSTEFRKSFPTPSALAGLKSIELPLFSSSIKKKRSKARAQSWPGILNPNGVEKSAGSRRSCPTLRAVIESAPTDLPIISLSIDQGLSRTRPQSWQCTLERVDTKKSTDCRRSLPLQALHPPRSMASRKTAETPSLTICQNPAPPKSRHRSLPIQTVLKQIAAMYLDSSTTLVEGKERSRHRSMPLQPANRHLATLATSDGTRNPAASARLQIYHITRSATISPTPQTPSSYDISISRFPLPPSRPLLLEPAAPVYRNSSLSFVSRWVYLQANESFATIDSDIYAPIMSTEILV